MWADFPWHFTNVAGDFNTVADCMSNSSEHVHRQHLIDCFMEKWNFCNSPVSQPTHIHYRSKKQRIIDYVYYGTTAERQLRIHSEVSAASQPKISDHHPIFTSISYRRGGVARKRPVWRPSVPVFCKNTFAALAEQSIDETCALRDVGVRVIQCAVSAKDQNPLLRGLL